MNKADILKIIREEVRNVMVQENILPDIIKSRHVGEGVRFLRAGTSSNKPTTPEKDGAVYYDTTNNKLFIGDSGSWLEETFT